MSATVGCAACIEQWVRAGYTHQDAYERGKVERAIAHVWSNRYYCEYHYRILTQG